MSSCDDAFVSLVLVHPTTAKPLLESREKGAANKRSERKERAKEKVFGMVVVG
jgi:hypothetical protein